jgi:microcystin-dependent protein
MIGNIITHTKNNAVGYLLCDGSVVSQSIYANLYAVIGNAFNIGGEGVGNFRLPNLVGRSAFGKDGSTEFSDLGSAGGAKTANLVHTHTPNMHAHNSGSGSTGGANSLTPDQSGSGGTIADHTHGISALTVGNASVNSMANGGNASQSIMNQFMTLYFLIEF